MGKTVFAHIEDGYGRLQLFVRQEEIGEQSHQIFRRLLDLGDFVQASGLMFRTKAGEVSLRVSQWKMLSKAISPLPVVKEEEVDGEIVRHSEFSNVEERYRQRYADLATNPAVRHVFRTRAKIITALRRFMDDNDFLEVETPILQPLYGGAAARPSSRINFSSTIATSCRMVYSCRMRSLTPARSSGWIKLQMERPRKSSAVCPPISRTASGLIYTIFSSA
ncbi:MAG: hypothetical protein HS099_08525 [Ardenticatenaceae bacterium]|nr:hypothetical protein [Ardenticatenaceae bacterium]